MNDYKTIIEEYVFLQRKKRSTGINDNECARLGHIMRMFKFKHLNECEKKDKIYRGEKCLT